MAPTATVTLLQGVTATIRVTGIVDDDGADLDVTTWTVRAQLRRAPRATELLAEWVTGTPVAPQGQATATGTTVDLAVPAAMSDSWLFDVAVLHIEVYEPVPPNREARVGDVRLTLDHSAIR